MKLIEDLGRLPYGNTGQLKRFGIYECPTCGVHYKCRTDHVISGRTTQCKNCAFTLKNVEINNIKKINFIKNAIALHGVKYTYTEGSYKNAKEKLEIKCNDCGTTFYQTPAKHLSGAGCPHCARISNSIALRMYSDKPTVLYWVKFTDTGLFKIGCTSASVYSRFKKDNEYPEVLLEKLFDFGGDAYRLEADILKEFAKYKYIGEPTLTSGNSEVFATDITEKVSKYFV